MDAALASAIVSVAALGIALFVLARNRGRVKIGNILDVSAGEDVAAKIALLEKKIAAMDEAYNALREMIISDLVPTLRALHDEVKRLGEFSTTSYRQDEELMCEIAKKLPRDECDARRVVTRENTRDFSARINAIETRLTRIEARSEERERNF